MAACMIVMNFLNFIFLFSFNSGSVTHSSQLWLQLHFHHSSSDKVHDQKQIQHVHICSSPSASSRPRTCHLLQHQFLHDNSTRSSEVPVATLLRALSSTADSDRCPFSFSERGRIKGKTNVHVPARRWAGREGMTARQSYIILELLWTLH